MGEEFQWDDDYQVEGLAERFEQMLRQHDDIYFDSEEFELLIEFYDNQLNNEKALLALSIGLEVHPDNNRLRIISARQMASEGKYVNALNLLNEIETKEPADVDILMTKGSVYSMMLDFSKAVQEYEKALVIVDEDEVEEIYSSIAYEYENMGAYETALIYLNKALEISENPEQILFEIGLCYELASNFDGEIEFFLHYVDKNPGIAAGWFNLGLSYNHLELYEKAIDAFEYVIAIDETNVPAYINMAQAWSSLGQYQKALELYHETAVYEPFEAMTLYFIGECHEKLQDYEKAMDFYQQAVISDEMLPDAWAGLSVIYDEQGDTAMAIYHIEKAIGFDDLNTEFKLIAADLYIKTKRYDKAKEQFQRIEELDPQDPDLWKEYAYMYIIEGETEKAVQVLKTGLIHQPRNASIIYRLVSALILNKNLSQAYFYLESALELDFDQHHELFEFMPSIKYNPKVIELITQYKPADKVE